MDIEPVNPGHILIIPNDHIPYLSDVDSNIAGHLFKVGQKISMAIRKSGLRCDGINFFLADGEAAMQEVFHVHLHVFPRFANDGFGFKYGEHNFTKPDRSELDHAAESIRKFL
jgi:histidine triad (HIT) family protein